MYAGFPPCLLVFSADFLAILRPVSSDTTDSQKTILKAMLDDANVRLAKLKKEQGVK